jgi:hypothetical protein
MEHDPTAIVSTSSNPPTHPTIHVNFFGPWGTQGNVPLGTTIDLSFTEGGHVANFLQFRAVGDKALALSSASWQLAIALARLIIIGL